MANQLEDPKTRLPKAFMKDVVGKKIVNVYYDEASSMPVIMLEDKSAIFVQSDDEGNGPGVPIHVSGEGGDQKEVGMWQIGHGW